MSINNPVSVTDGEVEPTTVELAFEPMTPEELCGTAEAWGVADKVKAAIIKVLTESDVYKEGMEQSECGK